MHTARQTRMEEGQNNIVSPNNRVERFIYGSNFKLFNEMFDEVVLIDERTVEVRLLTYNNWNKRGNGLLRQQVANLG